MAKTSDFCRQDTVYKLDQFLQCNGGLDVFSQISATHIIHTVQEIQQSIRRSIPSHAFQERGGMDEEAVLKVTSVSRKVLISWLATAMDVMDRVVTQFEDAMELDSKLEYMNGEFTRALKEKDDCQKKVIQLQAEVIEQKNDQLKNFQKTVSAEVKSYASVLSNSCALALAPAKIETAVKKIKESEDRSRNLMIHGLAENDKGSEDLKSKVVDVLSRLGENPMFSIPQRVGILNGQKVRPVKIAFTSATVVTGLLRKSHLLRTADGYSSVYISPDRSMEERTVRKELVNVLRRKRNEKPDLKFAIRDGKVVCIS